VSFLICQHFDETLGRPNRFFVANTFPGVDVMMTTFSDFCQFSAKNGVFLKNQCYDQFFFQKLSAVWAKNILKIITSVPDSTTA
jgi:hypothetical protein